MGALLNSLRRYRLFVIFIAAPGLAIGLVVLLILTLFSGSGADPEAATTPSAGSPTAGQTPALPNVAASVSTLQVAPTQTPVPRPTPVVTPTPTNPPEPTENPEPTPTPTPTGPIEYAIQPEETLSEIAERFGVSIEDIVKFNDLPDAELVFAGQIIEIPTDPSQIVERREANPDPVTAVVLPADGLNVRDKPNTTDSTVQYVAPGGSQLDLTGVVQEIEGLDWYEVEDGNWVQGRFLDIDAAAAPVATATATPASSEEATPTPTEGAAGPSPTPESGEALTAIVVPEGGLNVRVASQADAEVAYVAVAGTSLVLTGEKAVVDGITWWEIEDGNWVQGQFLRFD